MQEVPARALLVKNGPLSVKPATGLTVEAALTAGLTEAAATLGVSTRLAATAHTTATAKAAKVDFHGSEGSSIGLFPR